LSTGKKNLLALALAAGESPADVAAAAKISLRTLQRRQANPEFRRLVDELRAEFMSRAVGCMANNMTQAAKKLASLLDQDEPAVQLRAARAILGMGISLRDSIDVSARMRELEAVIAEKLGRVP
jgi:hypothetical protein